MKKLFLVGLLLSLTLTGCSKGQPLVSNSFCYEMKTSYDGSLSQTFSFPTFSQQLSEKYSEEQISAYYSILCKSIYDNVFSNVYLNCWLKYIENPIEEFALTGNRIEFQRPHIEKNDVVFSVSYSDTDSWRFFNSSKSEASAKESEQEFKMIYKVESSSTIPFLQKNSEGKTVAEIYRSIVNKTLKECFAKEDISKFDYNFKYRYITPYERVHSNANEIKRTAQGAEHTWTINSSLENEGEVKIWASEPNAGYWYLFALVGTVILAILTFAIYGIYKRCKKRHKNATLPVNKGE